jgi:hypothetical protein
MHVRKNSSQSSSSSTTVPLFLRPRALRPPAAAYLGTTPFAIEEAWRNETLKYRQVGMIAFDPTSLRIGDCGIRVDTGVLARRESRLLRCAVSGCKTTYELPEPESAPPKSFALQFLDSLVPQYSDQEIVEPVSSSAYICPHHSTYDCKHPSHQYLHSDKWWKKKLQFENVEGITEAYGKNMRSHHAGNFCAHRDRQMRETFESYSADYPIDAPNSWTWEPEHEYTTPGKKSYPYVFRAQNKVERLTKRIDLADTESENGSILVTWTTAPPSALFCHYPKRTKSERIEERGEYTFSVSASVDFVPSLETTEHRVLVADYERIKRPFVNAVRVPEKVRTAAAEDEDVKGSVGHVYRNYPADLNGLELVSVSGLPSTFVHPATVHTPSCERWSEPPLKIRVSSRKTSIWLPDPARDRIAFNNACAQRKQRFAEWNARLRGKHSKSLRAGAPDPRDVCVRCGGSFFVEKRKHLACYDCGKNARVFGLGREDRHVAGFDEAAQGSARVTVYGIARDMMPPDKPLYTPNQVQRAIEALRPHMKKPATIQQRIDAAIIKFAFPNPPTDEELAEKAGMPVGAMKKWLHDFRVKTNQLAAKDTLKLAA